MMTHNEIIEKKQALVQNDIDHFNRRMCEIEQEICELQKKKNALMQRISKKHVYLNQLESDKE